MNMSVPATIQDFHIALGKAVFIEEFQGIGDDALDRAMQDIPDSEHVATAQWWCAKHRSEMQRLANSLDRALGSGDVRLSIASDIMNDVNGIGALLANIQPSYVAEVFMAGAQQQGKKLRAFSSLVQRLMWSQ